MMKQLLISVACLFATTSLASIVSDESETLADEDNSLTCNLEFIDDDFVDEDPKKIEMEIVNHVSGPLYVGTFTSPKGVTVKYYGTTYAGTRTDGSISKTFQISLAYELTQYSEVRSARQAKQVDVGDGVKLMEREIDVQLQHEDNGFRTFFFLKCKI